MSFKENSYQQITIIDSFSNLSRMELIYTCISKLVAYLMKLETMHDFVMELRPFHQLLETTIIWKIFRVENNVENSFSDAKSWL